MGRYKAVPRTFAPSIRWSESAGYGYRKEWIFSVFTSPTLVLLDMHDRSHIEPNMQLSLCSAFPLYCWTIIRSYGVLLPYSTSSSALRSTQHPLIEKFVRFRIVGMGNTR